MSAARTKTANAPQSDATDEEMLAAFFQGLADPTRLKIISFLMDGPKTSGEIVRHVGRHQPTVSSHLTCLRFCGFVEAHRDGRNVWYRIMDRRVRRFFELGGRYLDENAERILECRVIAAERRR